MPRQKYRSEWKHPAAVRKRRLDAARARKRRENIQYRTEERIRDAEAHRRARMDCEYREREKARDRVAHRKARLEQIREEKARDREAHRKAKREAYRRMEQSMVNETHREETSIKIKIEPYEAYSVTDGHSQEEVGDYEEASTEGGQFVQTDEGQRTVGSPVAEAVQIKVEPLEVSSPAYGHLQEMAVEIKVEPLEPSSLADGYLQEEVLDNEETPVEGEQFVPTDEGQRPVGSPLACFIKEDFEGNSANLLNEWEEEYNENEVFDASNTIGEVEEAESASHWSPGGMEGETLIVNEKEPGETSLGDGKCEFNKCYKCERCDKVFNQKCSLKVHYRTHTNEKPYACEVCEKRFFLKIDLDRHAMIHSCERPFACEQCGRRFIRMTNLRRHMVTHTGLQPFECEVCGRKFSLKANMKNHMALHSGEKPYPCPVCGKRFSLKNYVSIHLLTHIDVKQFK